MMLRRFLLLAAVAVFSGCAPAPVLTTSAPTIVLRPADVAAEADRWRGSEVVWGGEVLEVRNRERTSEVVILAYPLDDAQRPQRDEAALGRFIAVLPGYVESYDYPPGRFVTVAGQIDGRLDDPVGEHVYAYALVRAEETHLWPVDFDRRRWHVGIGVSGAIR